MNTVAVEAPVAAERRPVIGRALTRLAPLLALIGLIGLWELICQVWDIREFTLPPPSAIADEMWIEREALADATWTTTQEVLLGFGLSVVVGIPLAVAIVYSGFIRNVLYPLFVASQAIPRVAIAPLLVLWFGFGLLPKVLVAFSIAFFPLVIAAVVGLQSVERETINVVRSMGASPLQTFIKVRLPASLPSLFGGLKVAVTLAVIGAIVGEFVGANAGLGYLIDVAQGNLNTRLIFASITLMALLGIVLFYIVEAIERVAVSWYFAARESGEERG